jgi:hypothetical protein
MFLFHAITLAQEIIYKIKVCSAPLQLPTTPKLIEASRKNQSKSAIALITKDQILLL